ncbi:MAG TPA: hypothetical protein VE685_04530 [Thermoanaerobaculia bacterium]|nr:hypothetical protein [Thermoanaerobaculia bacterium]
MSVLTAGCGNQGDPAPPLRVVPAPVRDLTVIQQGSRLLLGFSYPQTTPAGTALGGIAAVELFEVERPAPPDGKVPPLDPRQFEPAAQMRQRLEGADLQAVVFGDRILTDLPLPEAPAGTEAPAVPPVRYYAVRTFGKEGDRSDLSNIAAVLPKTPPRAPERVNAVARADGILVEWTPVDGVQGYSVYRRDAQEKSYRRPIHTAAPGEVSWLDTTARFGQNYIYTVTALAQREPAIESAIGSEREVRYADRFPPPPPSDLVALAEAGRVRIVWRSGEAADLAGYIVYRRSPEDGDFVRLTAQPIQATEYVDNAVAAGQTYVYRVTAVDQAGNESDPGGEVRSTLP